jgi:hypothetical protein
VLAVFCVRYAGEAPPPSTLRGPGDHEIRLLEEGPLGIWVAEGALDRPGLEAIAAHDAVVRAALRSATPVPVRFGTAFDDEQAARASLREREAELMESLERVAGRVEMGLRVEWDAAVPMTAASGLPRSGRDYLLARRSELDAKARLRLEADALLDQVERCVAPKGSLSVRKLLPEVGVAGLLAHLVHRQETASFRSRVDVARRQLPHAVLRLSGPWAPYSFV